MNAITHVDARLFAVPLAEVLSDAKHGDHTHFELITVTITLADGSSGTGYTYTGGRGGHAVLAMIKHDLAPFLSGRDGNEVEQRNDDMQWHMHYVGRGGIASFAISAVDIALWDARGKREGKSLVSMAGGRSQRCHAYCGGIDLNFSMDRLLQNIDAYLAQGFEAVKIKVGQPVLDDDVARVAGVRERLGDKRAFMVDANYALDTAQAIAAANAFKPHDLVWFEEPTLPDEFAAFATIADATGVPLAMGENLHTLCEFEMALTHSKLSFIQPDVGNCGGITTWLQVADRAEHQGIPVCSHGMQELHVSLVAGRGRTATTAVAGEFDPASVSWLEVHSFPIDQYTTRPLQVREHFAIAPDVPGTGVEFDWTLLEPHKAH